MLSLYPFARARSEAARLEECRMNHVAADGTAARNTGPTALALIGALLLLGGSAAVADSERRAEPRTDRTEAEHGPAHSDHAPRHGGQFFMAPNGWHHLEGALPRPDLFHLYLYDDHTRPIAATPFLLGARAWLQRYDTDGTAVGDRVELRLRPAVDGTRLEAAIPAGVRLPIEVELRLQLDPDRREALFNFDFPAASMAALAETRARRAP